MKLSEQVIDELSIPFIGLGGVEDYRAYARAIESEAYKNGQESMRERAAKECTGRIGTDPRHRYAKQFDGEAEECGEAISNLAIEEPSE